jgi:ubiquinone/menaquinone biosynthesis C-methylase UbiE
VTKRARRGAEILNREFWDDDADDYQAEHAPQLDVAEMAWGAWSVPEADLQVLGDVAGKDVLEYGCGAAQCAIKLARAGARVTGLDQSRSQLRHATEKITMARVPVRLCCASATAAPLRESSFDVVFCDHGAMSFCDPERTLPEVARVIRAGGVFAFCNATPYSYLTWNPVKGRPTRRLHRTYDDLGRQDFGEGTIDWVLGPGEWVRLLRAHGFDIEDLRELRPARGMTTTYGVFAPPSFARRWPVEWIWTTRRRA